MKEELKLRSEQVQEILGIAPNWMIRWGNFVIISYWIKYPDTLSSEISITTEQPIENILAGLTGTLYAIKVIEQSVVSKEGVLAVIYGNGKKDTLISSVSGQVFFMDSWEKGDLVKKSELLFRIVPFGSDLLMGKMAIPLSKVVKVCEGQEVRIPVFGMPNQENFFIRGRVKNVSRFPDQRGNFTVEVDFDVTSDTQLQNAGILPGIQANAEIVLTEYRLLERFFYSLRDAFHWNE